VAFVVLLDPQTCALIGEELSVAVITKPASAASGADRIRGPSAIAAGTTRNED